MNSKRASLFRAVLGISKHKAGELYPKWLLIVRALLFPLEFISYCAGINHGYQWKSNTWVIHGKEYSDKVFLTLSTCGDGLYKIVENDNKIVCVDLIKETKQINIK